MKYIEKQATYRRGSIESLYDPFFRILPYRIYVEPFLPSGNAHSEYISKTELFCVVTVVSINHSTKSESQD